MISLSSSNTTSDIASNTGDNVIFGRRMDTVSDFSNIKNDLEWDRHRDFNLMIESDTMSSYNLEERMAEIVKLNFLEFEIMSNATNSSCFKLCNNEEINLSTSSLNEPNKRPNSLIKQRKTYSSLDESSQYFSDTQSNLFTPPNAITLDDLFDLKRLTQTLSKNKLVRSLSLPGLRALSSTYLKAKTINLASKHLSLMNIDVKCKLVNERKQNLIRVKEQKRVEKSKCPWENGTYFSESIKKMVIKFSRIFLQVFDKTENNDKLKDDEFKASYSVASGAVTYKLNKTGGKIYPIDE